MEITPFVIFGCLILPTSGVANDGFMQDFFKRFPHLPFGNMNSFKYLHDQGSMAVTDSLIPSGDNFPFRKSDRSYFKSVSNENRITSTTLKKSPATVTTTSTVVTQNDKRVLFSRKQLYTNQKSSKPTVSSLPRIKSSYESFNIVSTTPSYGSRNLPQFGSSRIKELKQSFSSYSDQYNSRHFLYPHDKFHTQLLRPKIMGDSQYFSYDPFLQTQPTRFNLESTTTKESSLEKHFYYGDTTTMKPPTKYKVRMRAKKKGIVINEKAVSGEVKKLMRQEEEDLEDTPVTTLSPILTTTSSPLTTTSSTLPPSSVSDLPKMIVSDLPKRPLKKPSKYHYKLTTTTPLPKKKLFYPRVPTSPSILYSPLSYSQYNFERFMPTPIAPAASEVESPKLKYSYSFTTTKSPISSEEGPIVVMPPYTPAPNKSESPATTKKSRVYFAPQYVYKSLHSDSQAVISHNSISPELRTVGVDADIDNLENNTNVDGDIDPGKKYSYRVMGGNVNDVRGLAPMNDVHMNAKYFVDDPYYPPRVYHSPPPRLPPPIIPFHPSPYPQHVYNVEQSPEHKAQKFKYHSKIKYMTTLGPTVKPEFKYSSKIDLDENVTKRYLPHDKIIKATFYEDNEKKTDEIQNELLKSSPAKLMSKSPKLLRSRYEIQKDLDNSEENTLFTRNLNQLKTRQFYIEPTDVLSGFSPVKEHSDKIVATTRGKMSRVGNLGDAVNMKIAEQRITSAARTTTLTNNGIDNKKLERKQDLENNHTKNDKSSENDMATKKLLKSILQNFKSKSSKSTPKKKPLSPIQSIKENLFARFLRYFRREPKQIKMKSVPPILSTTTTRPLTTPDIADKLNDVRIPQNFIETFSRKKSSQQSQPTSQDSYRNFLRKLKKTNGRNES